MKRSVLIVDDDPFVRNSLSECLANEGYEILSATDAEEAMNIIGGHGADIAVLDVNLPGESGMELLNSVKKASPATGVVILTGYGTVEDAVEAMKRGAEDYLLKPCSMEELKIVMRRIASRLELLDENIALRKQLNKQYELDNIIGRSFAMRKVFERIEAVSDTEANVLIEGETGTGKDLVARALHRRSPRRNKPFVKVDCAALPETLLESELFGREKGAYTGATSSQAGRFEQAGGGVLFLDEVGNLSLATQAKLLNVIQDREFTRLGGDKRICVDIRLICASNADLDKAVAAGKFRDDLYFRINVIPIRLPPLRERPEDVPILANAFLEKYARDNRRDNLRISDEAMDKLCSYAWPGNVRELENAVERVVILTHGGEIGAANLPTKIARPDAPPQFKNFLPRTATLKAAVEEYEARVIRAALGELNGSREKTARRLGITRITLYNKMKRYGLLDGE
jgi:DNA-binding NtrC family response regulator